MRITVNGEPREVEDAATVAVLIARLTSGPRGVAVAVNEEVVPRSRWGGTELRSGDRVELLGAAQGG
ncbi:MAG TPA: sulfur carrier protein ThiS [Acidimicrobiia bacterium]|nr:sulfur carrier protein ThiS [Acidimicrobiia bacterium]